MVLAIQENWVVTIDWDYWDAQLAGFSNPYYAEGSSQWVTVKPMRVAFLEWLGMSPEEE